MYVRACLVVVALDQSSDRGPVSFFPRCNNTLGNLLMLVRSSGARGVGSST